MSTYPPIHAVSPEKFDLGTAQTPGSERLAAIAPELGIETEMWGGLFEVAPGARTGIRHHGKQQTIAYILSGTCEVRLGRKWRICRDGEGRRLHPGARVPAAYGNQSIECGTVPVGGGAEHLDTDRC
jgi:uncharacterized RmlC-like cupin family protein